MVEELIEKLDEQAFGDVFKPASKEELVGKRGFALFNQERMEVTPITTFEETAEFSKIEGGKFKQWYRQGMNFYGLKDKKTGNTFIVLVDLSRHLKVYDASGEQTKYVMD